MDQSKRAKMDDIFSITINKEKFESRLRELIREELPAKKEKELLNFQEAREFLGVSASTLNKWKSKNMVPYKKLGKRIFFFRTELLNSLKDSNYSKLKLINSK